jgi:hypothetical protein
VNPTLSILNSISRVKKLKPGAGISHAFSGRKELEKRENI